MALFSKRHESIDEVVARLVKDKRLGELEAELGKFDPAKLHGRDKESWHLHWGIAAFRRGDREEAFRRFTAAYAANPDSDEIAFSLGQEYEARGEPDRMVDLFHRCTFPKVTARTLLAASRYCYLWNKLDDGSQFLEPIIDAYFRLGIADDNFLHMRGLPFVSQTWGYMLCFAALKGDFSRVEQFAADGRKKLTECDFTRLGVLLGCYRAGSFEAKIERLAVDVHSADARFPQGYPRTQLACLRAVSLDDATAAQAYLDSVVLAQNDFPWLADIVLIQRARLSGLAADFEGESKLIEQFFHRQPLLFEPDHTVNFGLLLYQEKLKEMYQKRRTTKHKEQH